MVVYPGSGGDLGVIVGEADDRRLRSTRLERREDRDASGSARTSAALHTGVLALREVGWL
jgi:hypothetical protein